MAAWQLQHWPRLEPRPKRPARCERHLSLARVDGNIGRRRPVTLRHCAHRTLQQIHNRTCCTAALRWSGCSSRQPPGASVGILVPLTCSLAPFTICYDRHCPRASCPGASVPSQYYCTRPIHSVPVAHPPPPPDARKVDRSPERSPHMLAARQAGRHGHAAVPAAGAWGTPCRPRARCSGRLWGSNAACGCCSRCWTTGFP